MMQTNTLDLSPISFLRSIEADVSKLLRSLEQAAFATCRFLDVGCFNGKTIDDLGGQIFRSFNAAALGLFPRRLDR